LAPSRCFTDVACGLRRSPGLAVLPARPSRSVALRAFRCSVLRCAASALQSRVGDGLLAATCNFGGPPSSRARSLRLLSGALSPTVRYKKPRIGDAACDPLENFARVGLNFLTHYFPERSLSAAHLLAVRLSVASERLVPANRVGKRSPVYPRASIFLFASRPLDPRTHPPGSIRG